MDTRNLQRNNRLLLALLQQDDVEQQTANNLSSEILAKLNISIDSLPHKCQGYLLDITTEHEEMCIEQLDALTLSLQHSQQMFMKLDEENEMLKLQQKNALLQAEIDRNERFLKSLRTDLEYSRESLQKLELDPDQLQDSIRQLKQKIASYEESCEKTMVKFSKLSVPECAMPRSLQAQLSTLESLREDEASWKQQADDVLFTRDARNTFGRLRR
ncbi:uncharacterized protein [Battus philenor]|uniref:uncharacterized protein n=1 Tax=Battus philenor TaxID=42288 RepID=UPI0035CE8D45